MFKITIVEIPDNEAATPSQIERYSQTVDTISLSAVIAAINRKPRIRTKKDKTAGAQP